MLTIHFNGLEGLSRLVKRLKAAVTGRDELRELATNYDLSRPIQWNEKAYGPKPERLSKKPSAHAVSDSPSRATTPIRADQP